MKKIIQSVFLFSFLLFLPNLFAQNLREKKVFIEKKITVSNETKDVKQTTSSVEKTTPVNQPEMERKVDFTSDENLKKPIVEISNDTERERKEKKAFDDTKLSTSMTDNKTNVEVNTTYTKELPEENVKNTVSEKVRPKVEKSSNYQPHVVKEDVQNTQVQQRNTAPQVSAMKKVYLQQEADELEQEIEKFKNDPNYNLVEKQKQLEYLKKLLK